MKALSLKSFGLGLALMASALASNVKSQPSPAPPPVGLARIVSSIPKGTPWADIESKFLTFAVSGACFPAPDRSKTLPWGSNIGDVNLAPYVRSFSSALKESGLTAADDPDKLIKLDKSGSDLLAAADIKSIKASLCVPYSRGGKNRYWNLAAASGEITFVVDWQIYSVSRDKTIYKTEVTSHYNLDKQQEGNIDRLIQGGVEESIRLFARSPALKSAILEASAPQSVLSEAKPKLLLANSLKQTGGKIGEAVGSVVLILSAGGHGSGFLVSSDGYLITAEHVIGSDKYVKIRWSDGLEGVGEVIRTDKRRDVALIKTDPRGRQPLALRREAPQPGDTVFAIGAPIDPKLQNTVTRGVVSANRIMDGFSFIQSDVTVDPGNSGGPLLDEQGRVLGFTDKGLRSAEAPTGLNFFVPIDDALRFLSAEPQ